MFGEDEPAHLFYLPRPDDHARYDQQESFLDEKLTGVAFCVGGNGAGCLHKDQFIYDPVLRTHRKVSEIDSEFHVWSLTSDGRVVVSVASRPKVYGVEKLYRIGLSNGASISVTLGHRVWTGQAWREIGDILREETPVQLPSATACENIQSAQDCEPLSFRGTPGAPQSFERATRQTPSSVQVGRTGNANLGSLSSPPCEHDSQKFDVDATPEWSLKCAPSSTRTTPDYQDGCSPCCRPCDEQLLAATDSGRSSFPSRVDARGRNHDYPHMGDLGNKQDDTHTCRSGSHLSTSHCDCQGLHDREAGNASSAPCSRSSALVDTQIQSSRSNMAGTHLPTGEQPVQPVTCLHCKAESFHRSATAFSQGDAPSTARFDCESCTLPREGQRTHSPCGGGILSHCESPSILATLETTGFAKCRLLPSQTDTTESSAELAKGEFSGACVDLLVDGDSEKWVHITSVEYINEEEYWDFSVPVHENYWCEGIWNHNTTTAALVKVARFLMEQKPPRHDTPFWIISDSYGQVCDVAWKEKFWNNQILPRDEIDESRITWRNRNKQHPDTVPLKPWPDDPSVNWTLHFKSYGQGRQEFQAASIGGFCFIEQFPWDLLTETIARCRDYFFPGSMIAEFTPIDPNLSMTIQEMQENGYAPGTPDPKKRYLPDGWKVYRSNTLCAMEHGHVSKDWFEQFFGSMDEAEREVRMKGAWASFEGQIYQSFNPFVHGITLDEIYANDGDFPQNVQHRRAIDWGFSAEHAFVCLWGYWEPSSHDWVVYDEYWSVDQTLTVNEHLWHISDRWEWPQDGYHGMSYADPSRLDHIRIAGRLNEYKRTDQKTGEEFTSQPILLQNASNSIYEGIDHVRSLLSINRHTGKPRLRICQETCPYLWRQMQTYRWERGNDSGLNPHSARPVPLKKDDDAVDALRYLVFSDAKRLGMTIQQQVHQESGTRRLIPYRRAGKTR